MLFPQKSPWNMIFFCIIGKDHVSLSRKYDLNLRGQMKDDLFQKNTRACYIFCRPSEKKGFSRGAALGHDLSCMIWKDGIFFLKTRYFFLGQGASDDLSVYTCGCYKPGVTSPLPKKIKDGLIQQKYA